MDHFLLYQFEKIHSSITGDVASVGGMLMGRGKTAMATSKKTFTAPLMVDFTMKQLGRLDRSKIAQPKSMVMLVHPREKY